MATPDDLLSQLAEGIVANHGLDQEHMSALAGELDLDNESGYASFTYLINLLLNPTVKVPDWLAAPDCDLPLLTEDEFETIILLVETRFWSGELGRLASFCWPWKIVFGTSRMMQRVLASKHEVQTAWAARRGGGCSWFSTLPAHGYEDLHPSYEVLRKAYFPGGVDDALAGFARFYREIATALHKLRKRCNLLGTKTVSRVSLFAVTVSNKVDRVAGELAEVLRQAKAWHAAVQLKMQYNQLPGVSFGYAYGKDFRIDPEIPWLVDLLTDRPNSYSIHDVEYTPIRFKAGTSWQDWFRNVFGTEPALAWAQKADLMDQKPGNAGVVDLLNPLRMMLPQAVCTLVKCFEETYDWADHDVHHILPNLMITGAVVDPKQSMRQAKRLATGTGHSYWRTRRVDYSDRAKVANTTSLMNSLRARGRPKFDCAGNLRLDYMSAVLYEVYTGCEPDDYLLGQDVTLITGA